MIRQLGRMTRVAMTGLMGVLIAAGPVLAVEYRLQVVNIWDSAFTSFLKPGELDYGASGPGLNRLEDALDRGEVGLGPVVSDRTLRWASEAVARMYGATRVLAEVKPGSTSQQRWDEVKWEGKPGERSVWVVAPGGRGRPQELYRVALKGTGPLRQFLPYPPSNGHKLAAVKFSLNFLWAYEERGGLWEKYVSRSLDLSDGIAVVVGENFNRTFPDEVHVIVQQGEQPTTYKAILVWRDPEINLEAPQGPKSAPPIR